MDKNACVLTVESIASCSRGRLAWCDNGWLRGRTVLDVRGVSKGELEVDGRGWVQVGLVREHITEC